MRTPRIRCQLYLPEPLSKRLDAIAAKKPGTSRTAILTQALEAWLDRRAGHELDDRFGVRLDRLSTALGRVERDGQVILETLALFVRYELAVTPPLAGDDPAARAVARDRFEAFVRRVGESVASGRRTLAPPAEQQP